MKKVSDLTKPINLAAAYEVNLTQVTIGLDFSPRFFKFSMPDDVYMIEYDAQNLFMRICKRQKMKKVSDLTD